MSNHTIEALKALRSQFSTLKETAAREKADLQRCLKLALVQATASEARVLELTQELETLNARMEGIEELELIRSLEAEFNAFGGNDQAEAVEDQVKNEPAMVVSGDEPDKTAKLPSGLRELVKAANDSNLTDFILDCWDDNKKKLKSKCEDCNEPVHSFKMHGSFWNWYPKCSEHARGAEFLDIPPVILYWIVSHDLDSAK